MALTNRQVTSRLQKRLKKNKPYVPTARPAVINLHTFDMSTIPGEKTCLQCGQLRGHRLHIQPHTFSPNFDSKRGHCLCGLRPDNPIHRSIG